MAKIQAKHCLDVPIEWSRWSIDPGVMSPAKYVEFAAEKITGAIKQAWKERKSGGISFGLTHASVGHNSLTSYYDDSSQMYGCTDHPDFSHIEGYENNSLGLLYSWDVA